jgi:hypothetical protein
MNYESWVKSVPATTVGDSLWKAEVQGEPVDDAAASASDLHLVLRRLS